jgi:hypothetical protein
MHHGSKLFRWNMIFTKFILFAYSRRGRLEKANLSTVQLIAFQMNKKRGAKYHREGDSIGDGTFAKNLTFLWTFLNTF